MSWYSESGATFPYRVAIALDNDQAATNATDFTITVPTDLEMFWANIQADGDDVRVVTADGLTKLTYQLGSFTYATRTLTIEIDNFTPSQQDSMAVVWLYWGDASVASGAGSFTASTPRNGYVMVGGPAPGALVLKAQSQGPDVTLVAQEMAKVTDEISVFWWDITELLNRRQVPYNDKTQLEEVKSILFHVDTAGSPVAALFDLTKSRLVSPGFVRCWLTAGVDGTDYVAITQIEITDGQDDRLVDLRVLVKVNDADET